MRLPKKFVPLAVGGALALGSLGFLAPIASAETTSAAAAGISAERAQAITDALSELVSGGTLTQEQADAVATTLAESGAMRGGGHPGGRLLDMDVAATALGITEDALRTALEADGATLTTVAEAQGVDVSALRDALTAAATERIGQRVAAGDITQEQADEKLAALPDRISTLLTAEIGDRQGPGGDRGRHPAGAGK